MIGERLKEARKRAGYSAEEVAIYLNVSPATIYRYENGTIEKVPLKYAKPLGDLLNVDPAYLMGWENDYLELEQSEPEEDVKPKTIEAKIVSYGIDQLPKEQREQILNVVRAMCSNHPELFQERK